VSFVFEGWSPWTWVSIAWSQLLLAYGGYLAYLGWRRRQLLREHGARESAKWPAAPRDPHAGGPR
jgi:hypothetical protein